MDGYEYEVACRSVSLDYDKGGILVTVGADGLIFFIYNGTNVVEIFCEWKMSLNQIIQIKIKLF